MTVYITQEVRKSTSDGSFHPQFNFKPALKFGELRVLVPAGMSLLSPVPLIRTLKEKLATFSDEDYLLAVGDPSVVAAASIIAAGKNEGRVRMLKWDREISDYIPVELDTTGRPI
jgi:alcohol dehydrogenase YqhD (iron-dependent ADH family)